MSTRNVFTVLTPLPPSITRETAVGFLHNHVEMIDLNPLVTDRHPIDPPPHASPEEQSCIWFSVTDRLAHWPGSHVSFTCAFHDLERGLQTHCYAPLGVDIRETWSVAGSLPGEPREPVELGLGAPASGLYLREDVDLRCNFVMATFVKRTLKRAHATLVEHLVAKAQLQQQQSQSQQRPIHAPADTREQGAAELE
ncbi:hypothetical protein HRG_002061 [Hirsutella rhossiliensis]|uniref:DUF7053 domain-containing protein n=1 Tax=Hirsutella rhossiliensis TaxID=111463 RepID=A0A9P8N4V4_9HYPO|nr:uncharacterized protein HRG_02061 [Hirsutella rhossiliensis]KAH0966652.1 hypothetical protein HRG_02061 [Hirsutella rhossiliensis]